MEDFKTIEIKKEEDIHYENNPDWKPHYWERDGKKIQVGWKKLDSDIYAMYPETLQQMEKNMGCFSWFGVIITIIGLFTFLS